MAAALLLRSQGRSIPANPGIPASRPSARAGYYAVGDHLVTDAGTSLGSLWHYGGGPDAWSQRGSIPASPGVPASRPFAGEGHYAFGDNLFTVAGSSLGPLWRRSGASVCAPRRFHVHQHPVVTQPPPNPSAPFQEHPSQSAQHSGARPQCSHVQMRTMQPPTVTGRAGPPARQAHALRRSFSPSGPARRMPLSVRHFGVLLLQSHPNAF